MILKLASQTGRLTKSKIPKRNLLVAEYVDDGIVAGISPIDSDRGCLLKLIFS